MMAWQNGTGNGMESDWPYMFTTNTTLSIGLDDWDEYESGAIDATRSCDQQARILMFGAIRRAAMLAREYEKRADNAWQVGDEVMESECWNRAIVVRRTIRIAIGSDKI